MASVEISETQNISTADPTTTTRKTAAYGDAAQFSFVAVLCVGSAFSGSSCKIFYGGISSWYFMLLALFLLANCRAKENNNRRGKRRSDSRMGWDELCWDGGVVVEVVLRFEC